MPKSMQTAQNIGGTSVKRILGEWRRLSCHHGGLSQVTEWENWPWLGQSSGTQQPFRNLSGLQHGLCHMDWAGFLHEHVINSASHSPGSWEGSAQGWKKHRDTLCRTTEVCSSFPALGQPNFTAEHVPCMSPPHSRDTQAVLTVVLQHVKSSQLPLS